MKNQKLTVIWSDNIYLKGEHIVDSHNTIHHVVEMRKLLDSDGYYYYCMPVSTCKPSLLKRIINKIKNIKL